MLGVVEQGHVVGGRAEHEDLAAGLHQLGEGRAFAVAVVERMVGREPVRLGADGGAGGTRIGAAARAGGGAHQLHQCAVLAIGARGGRIEGQHVVADAGP
jgi:hypothetical protein